MKLITPFLLAGLAASTMAVSETHAQMDARMKWWKEARFGLFLHWGLYAVPAGEYKGKTNYAEWILEEAHIPVATYEKFEGKFNPVKFNADKWVLMAKNAGMKYIVITSKHHEGFNMFASKYTNYNIMNTPFKRDVMKELAAACKRHGLKMCFYHSIMDWHHPDYLPRRSWESRPVDGANMDRYVKYLRNDVSQLLTNYGPIGIMWFDGEWESTWNHKYGQALYDLCRKLQPNVIVNNRVDVGRSGMAGMSTAINTAGDYGTPEQEIPAQGIPNSYWETCMTMNDHWGYNKHDFNYKTSQDLIRKLVDISSKGGNFLLNIGPTAQGEFPPLAQDRLKAIGAWMHVNSKAIYSTDASPFPALSWGRCTQGHSGGHRVLYLDVFNWPGNGKLVVPGIGNKPIHAYLLANKGKALNVSRHEGDLVVSVPVKAPDANCSVVALEISGAPVIYQAPQIEADTTYVVQPVTVKLSNGSPNLAIRYTTDGSEPSMSSHLYAGAFRVTSAETVKAKSFAHGKPVSGTVAKQFVAATLQPATPLSPDMASTNGLDQAVYKGDWDTVPNFDKMTPESTGIVSKVTVAGFGNREHFGLSDVGYVTAPVDGVYNFELSSDDGSVLKIDGKTIVLNDGLHAMTPKTGSIALAAGFHSIRIDYFNKTGSLGLSLRWGLAGKPLHEAKAGELATIK